MKQIRSTFSSDLTNSKLNALCFKREQNVCVYQYLYKLSNDDDDDMW